MNKYLVIFRGDTNDADYIHNHEVVDKDTLDKLQNIINKLVNISRDRNENGWFAKFPERREFMWPTSEYRDSDVYECYPGMPQLDLDLLNDYMPNGEFGIHTGQVSFYILASEEMLLL